MAKHTFIVNDESLNIGGFKVLTDGIDLSRYQKNPVVKVMHDSYKEWMPIAKTTELRIEDGRLLADIEFDQDDELAVKVEKKVVKKMINATSLGLRELQWSEDMMELQRSELLEISIVDVPANANTVALHRSGKVLELSAENASIIKEKLHNKNRKTMNELWKLLLSIKLEDTPVVNLSAAGQEPTEEEFKKAFGMVSAKIKELSAATADAVAAQKKAEDDLKAEQDKSAEVKADALVNLHCSLGKFPEGQKDFYKSAALNDYEATEKQLLGMSARQSLVNQIQNNGNAGKQTNEEGTPLIDLSFKVLDRNHSKFLAALKTEQPEVWAEKYEQQYGKKPQM